MDVGTFVQYQGQAHVLICRFQRGDGSTWAVIVSQNCDRKEVNLAELDYLSRPLRSGDRMYTSFHPDTWGTVLAVDGDVVRCVRDDGLVHPQLLSYCWPGNWEQLALDWLHEPNDKSTCGKSAWQSVHVYSSKGSLYYRYCWGRGDKVEGYQHIKGGNTDNPVAIARAEQVRLWIKEGKSRQWVLNEVKKLDRKRKK